MSLSISATTKLLGSLNHKPKKKLGQNFLVDGNIVRKSLSMASLKEGLPIVEIGPGLGTLTQELLEQNHCVFAVEIDQNLIGNLERKFSKFITEKKFFLLHADAVKNPTGLLPDSVEDFAVVANLPYSISSPWLESLLNSKQIPSTMVLMLQRETLDRMKAPHSTKNYSALTIFLESVFEYKKVYPVSKQCFFPIPKIDSVLAKMNRKKKIHLYSPENRTLIRKIFTQRRKQIGSITKKEDKEVQTKLYEWMKKNEIAQSSRPEQIEPFIWQTLP